MITFLQRAVIMGIPLLFGATGETITEKSGHLNLGIPGIMYVGAISGVIGAFYYENSVGAANIVPFLAILIPLLCSILGSLLMGLIYSFFTVSLRANQNVTGLALTTFGVGILLTTLPAIFSARSSFSEEDKPETGCPSRDSTFFFNSWRLS